MTATAHSPSPHQSQPQAVSASPTLWWNRLSPSEGWLTLALVSAMFFSVVWAVEAAHWIREMPELGWVGWASLVAAFVLSRVKTRPSWQLIPLGLVLGAGAIFTEMLVLVEGETWQDRATEFVTRMSAWWELAQSGGVSRDPIPFLLWLVGLTWIVGFASVWAVFRWHSAWMGVFPPGIAILANLSYIPGRLESYFILYCLWAILLLMRMQLVNQKGLWARDKRVDIKNSDFSLMFNASIWGVVLLWLAWIVPVGRAAPNLNDVWLQISEPWFGVEREFERLFGALVPTRAVQLHDFGHGFAFRGGIDFSGTGQAGPRSASNLNDAIVMTVESDAPRYWKGRSYDIYTSQGWESGEEMNQPLGWRPTGTVAQNYQFRQRVEQTIETAYPTDLMFFAGQPISATVAARIEVPLQKPVHLDLVNPGNNRTLSPQLRSLARDIGSFITNSRRLISPDEIIQRLPPDLELQDVNRSGTQIRGLQVLRTDPNPPDVTSLSAAERLQRGTKYTVASTVSVAPLDFLQKAGEDYPGWVTDRFLQLPQNLPSRVRALANSITANAPTPYDKAKEIESYLRNIPFSLDIDAPPAGRDAVDHFLFDSKVGYSDYHASAMVLLLRAVGVPARLATGYVGGEYDEEKKIYTVRERQGHAWPEVFFPQFGWVEFEPTPALPAIDRPLSDEFIQSVLGNLDFDSALGLEEIPEEDLFPPEDESATLESQADNGALWVSLLASMLVLLTMAYLSLRFLWLRGLSRLSFAQQSYAKLCRLASFSPIGGPKPHETAEEYGRRLTRFLPAERSEISKITRGYVWSEYGKKSLSGLEIIGIAQAWTRLRKRLLLRILHRD